MPRRSATLLAVLTALVGLFGLTGTVVHLGAQESDMPGVALSDGTPYAVRILDQQDGRVYVSYVGWDSSYDEWLPADVVGAAPTEYASGDRVFAVWSGNGTPYRAQIIGRDGDRYQVRYDDGTSEWRPWDQIHPVTIRQASIPSRDITQAERFTTGDGPFETGDIVAAFWPGDPWWYDAEVIDVRSDGAYRVRYLDDGSEEWLAEERVRAAASAPVEREYDRAALSNYADRVSVTINNPSGQRWVIVLPDGARQQTDDSITVALPRGTDVHVWNPNANDRLGALVREIR